MIFSAIAESEIFHSEAISLVQEGINSIKKALAFVSAFFRKPYLILI